MWYRGKGSVLSLSAQFARLVKCLLASASFAWRRMEHRIMRSLQHIAAANAVYVMY